MSTFDVDWSAQPIIESDAAVSASTLPAGATGAGRRAGLSPVPLTVPLAVSADAVRHGAGAGAAEGERLGNGAAEPPAQSGVNTLRAILLRGQTPSMSTEARLSAIERRLEALSLELAQGPADQREHLASLRQQVDALAQQAQSAGAVVPPGQAVPVAADPAAAERLASVEHQVAELRQDHDQLAANATAFANELDQACRLRQRRVRVANRLELQRLRRRVYAPPGAFAGSGHTSAARSAPPYLAGQPSQPAIYAVPNEAGLVGSEGEVMSAGAPYWPLPRHVEAVSRPGAADHVVLRTAASGTLDASGAWYEVRHATTSLMLALWALLVVLGHLIAEDARETWAWIREEWHGRRQ